MAETLPWLPDLDNAHVTAQRINPSGLEIDLAVSANAGELNFGKIPRGWSIRIDCSQARGDVVLTAKGAESATHWNIVAPGRGSLYLPAVAYSVDVEASSSRAHLILGGRRTKLVVTGEHVQVDAPAISGLEQWPYTLIIRRGAHRKVELLGSAKPRKLQSDVSLETPYPLNAGRVEVVGDLISPEIDALSLDITGTIYAPKVRAANISAKSILSSQAHWNRGPADVRASTLVLEQGDPNLSISGHPDAAAHITLSRTSTFACLSDAVIQFEARGAIQSQGHSLTSSVVENLEVRGVTEGLTVRDAARGLVVECTKNLYIGGELTGLVDIQCDRAEFYGNILAGGDIRASEMVVNGSLCSEAGDLKVTVAETLQVTGEIHNLRLIGAKTSSQLLVGTTAQRDVAWPTIDDEDIDFGSIPTENEDRPAIMTSSKVEFGEICVNGSVSESTLIARGAVLVFGHFSHDGGDSVGELLSGERALVSQRVRVGSGAIIRAASVLAAREWSGGSIEDVALRVQDVTDRGLKVIARRLEGANVRASQLGVEEDLVRSLVEVDNRLIAYSGIDKESRIAINGSGSVGSDAGGEILWRPQNSEAALRLVGTVENVSIASPVISSRGDKGERYPQVIAADSAVRNLVLAGAIDWLSDGKSGSRISMIRCEGSAGVCFQSGSCVTESCLVGDELHVRVDVGQGNEVSLGLATADSSANVEVYVESGRVVIEPPARADLPSREVSRLRARAGEVVISSTIGRLEAGTPSVRRFMRRVQSVADAPHISVERGGIVRESLGAFHLSSMHGTLISRETGNPARLLSVGGGVSHDEKTLLSGGVLIGLDVSTLSLGSILHLEDLDVFDPHGATLQRGAIKKLEDVDLRQDRAERFAALSRIVARRAAGGATRSRVLWASVRAHHAASRSRIEWCARWIHWLIGYGQRPFAPLLCLVGVIMGIAGILTFVVDEDVTCASPDGGPRPPSGGFWHQALRVALIPAGVLRLESGGAPSVVAVNCSQGWHVGTFGVLSLFLVAFVVALRNYLWTPVRASWFGKE